MFLVSQQCGLVLVNFMYSRILTFQCFEDDSEGDEYLKWSTGLVIPCVHRFFEDGSLVPKYVGVGTCCELCFMVCDLLYFIKCICCVTYWRWQKLPLYANKITEISLYTNRCQKVYWYTSIVTQQLYFYTSKGTEKFGFNTNKMTGAISAPQQGYRLSLYTNKMAWVARSEVLTEVLSLHWRNYPSIWIRWLRGYTFILIRTLTPRSYWKKAFYWHFITSLTFLSNVCGSKESLCAFWRRLKGLE